MVYKLLTVALYGLFLTTSVYAFSGDTDNHMLPALRHSEVVVIHEGEGGMIDEHLTILDDIVEQHRKIIIDGKCYSACTLFLWLPPENVCWTKHAKFYFHSASDGKDNIDESSRKWDAWMLDRYAAPVAAWIGRVDAYRTTNFTQLPRDILEAAYGNKRCING